MTLFDAEGGRRRATTAENQASAKSAQQRDHKTQRTSTTRELSRVCIAEKDVASYVMGRPSGWDCDVVTGWSVRPTGPVSSFDDGWTALIDNRARTYR